MQAQAWTAIGLLAATLLGALFYLGNRIDSLGARIDSLGARLDAHIDGLSVRVEEQGRQLGSAITSWPASWTATSSTTPADRASARVA